MCLYYVMPVRCFFFFKQKTAYEMRISDWSSDVCSSDLVQRHRDRSERVLHIVASRHRQVDARNRAAIAIAVAHPDVEAVTVGARRPIGATPVCLGREAPGESAGVAGARKERLPLGWWTGEARGWKECGSTGIAGV